MAAHFIVADVDRGALVEEHHHDRRVVVGDAVVQRRVALRVLGVEARVERDEQLSRIASS